MEAALGALLESVYRANSVQADILPEEKPVKAATRVLQSGKVNGRRTPVTGNSPPTKRRGTSRTPKTPVKRRAVPVADDEQEDSPVSLFTSKNGVPDSELFENSDKFFQLLGRSRSKVVDCRLNSQIVCRHGSKPIRGPRADQIEDQVAGNLGSLDEGNARNDPKGS